MLKIVTIIGARPQIIKAAALSRAIREKFSEKITEVIVHTGQHYDENMSKVFIDEMQIPEPDYNLNVGSASHGQQTALMIEGIEKILIREKPAYIVLFGDTNSTLAGAIAAAKIHIPIVHIEAGLRSFSKKMPEEINRIMCDHASTLLFSPTETGFRNLIKEGFNPDNKRPFTNDNPGIYHCGDVMYDNSLHFAEIAEKNSRVLVDNNIQKDNYVLGTIHRDNNTDEPKRLNAIFSALNKISLENKVQVVIPLHPRTSKLLEKNLEKSLFDSIKQNDLFKIMEPVSFLDMIKLENNSKLIITDSGGVQKEAYFFGKTCIIMRPETEWVEIVASGNAIIADADETKILNAYNHFENLKSLTFPLIFGDGKAAEFICGEMLGNG
ncbi:MAG: UDP-N-acetylglucosamine 2-epimerase (non-hydrolyzing) [Saprospiraceae bacterium]|nr:UDP-N-acetylglucosamine 2-epimerase (non-hydrolyzing) [Saprospiraceae bacterium]